MIKIYSKIMVQNLLFLYLLQALITFADQAVLSKNLVIIIASSTCYLV